MTLVDNEDRRDIVNPYIELMDPSRKLSVALNTETFRKAQKELINIADEDVRWKYHQQGKKLYPVFATVGRQDHALDWRPDGSHFGRGVRADMFNETLASVALGYLTEEFIKENFPQTYSFFESSVKSV